MKFAITVNAKPALDALKNSAQQVPYAQAIMLTRLAVDAREAVKKNMPVAFDRPTAFTLRGVFSTAAKKSKPEAIVYVPDSIEASGRAKREYIRPGALGTSHRQQKRTEFLLTRMGYLPAGWVTTPGKSVQLDAYGNLPGSVYKQVINVLQIRGDTKPVSQRSVKGAKRLGVASLFFAVAPGPNKQAKNGGWLPPGVWKHLPGGKITQILKFVKKASYKERLDVKKVVGDAVAENLQPAWRDASAIITERFSRNKAGK